MVVWVVQFRKVSPFQGGDTCDEVTAEIWLILTFSFDFDTRDVVLILFF